MCIRDRFWSRSDHFPLYSQLKVPTLMLFGGLTPDYHKPTDTADKVDADKVRRVSRLVLRILDQLQATELGF